MLGFFNDIRRNLANPIGLLRRLSQPRYIITFMMLLAATLAIKEFAKEHTFEDIKNIKNPKEKETAMNFVEEYGIELFNQCLGYAYQYFECAAVELQKDFAGRNAAEFCKENSPDPNSCEHSKELGALLLEGGRITLEQCLALMQYRSAEVIETYLDGSVVTYLHEM